MNFNFFKGVGKALAAVSNKTKKAVIGLGMVAGLVGLSANDAHAQKVETDTLKNTKTRSVLPDGRPLRETTSFKTVRKTKDEDKKPIVGSPILKQPKVEEVQKERPLTRAEAVAAYKLRRSKMTQAQRDFEDANYLKNKKTIDAAAKKDPKTKTIKLYRTEDGKLHDKPPVPVLQNAPLAFTPPAANSLLKVDTTSADTVKLYTYTTEVYYKTPGRLPGKLYGGGGTKHPMGKTNWENNQTYLYLRLGGETSPLNSAPGTLGSKIVFFGEVDATFKNPINIAIQDKNCNCNGLGILNPNKGQPILSARTGGRVAHKFNEGKSIFFPAEFETSFDATQRDRYEVVKGKRRTPDQEKAQDILALRAALRFSITYHPGKNKNQGWEYSMGVAAVADSRKSVMESPRSGSDPTNRPYGTFAVNNGMQLETSAKIAYLIGHKEEKTILVDKYVESYQDLVNQKKEQLQLKKALDSTKTPAAKLTPAMN